MLNFNNLVKEKIILVPLVDNTFQYHSKKYSVDGDNGWYKIKIQGNNAEIESQAYNPNEIETQYKSDLIKGYIHGNNIVFQNFDVAKRKYDFGLTKEIYFNNALTFSAVKAIVWENKRIYYLQPDYKNFKVIEVKSHFDAEKNITDLKDTTPELKTVFLFHSIQRDNLRALEASQKKEEEHEKLMEDLPYRLKHSFEKSGATLL